MVIKGLTNFYLSNITFTQESVSVGYQGMTTKRPYHAEIQMTFTNSVKSFWCFLCAHFKGSHIYEILLDITKTS